MRIIIEFDAANSPTIKFEQSASQSGATGSGSTGSSSGSNTNLRDGVDAGQAPSGGGTEAPLSSTSVLLSGSQENMAIQSGVSDGGGFSGGAASVSLNNN